MRIPVNRAAAAGSCSNLTQQEQAAYTEARRLYRKGCKAEATEVAKAAGIFDYLGQWIVDTENKGSAAHRDRLRNFEIVASSDKTEAQLRAEGVIARRTKVVVRDARQQEMFPEP